ncbi:hypothetical protein [Microbacterium sp. bgisy189]|uniref:hypothetical protein n=1 Tax=Microbacterium sp. bgisy189 TaxID=3413798 RepID=UPI003EBE8502
MLRRVPALAERHGRHESGLEQRRGLGGRLGQQPLGERARRTVERRDHQPLATLERAEPPGRQQRPRRIDPPDIEQQVRPAHGQIITLRKKMPMPLQQRQPLPRPKATPHRQHVTLEHEPGIVAQLEGMHERRIRRLIVTVRRHERDRQVPPHDRIGGTGIRRGAQPVERIDVASGVEQPHAEQACSHGIRRIRLNRSDERVVLIQPRGEGEGGRSVRRPAAGCSRITRR